MINEQLDILMGTPEGNFISNYVFIYLFVYLSIYLFKYDCMLNLRNEECFLHSKINVVTGVEVCKELVIHAGAVEIYKQTICYNSCLNFSNLNFTKSA